MPRSKSAGSSQIDGKGKENQRTRINEEQDEDEDYESDELLEEQTEQIEENDFSLIAEGDENMDVEDMIDETQAELRTNNNPRELGTLDTEDLPMLNVHELTQKNSKDPEKIAVWHAWEAMAKAIHSNKSYGSPDSVDPSPIKTLSSPARSEKSEGETEEAGV